MRALTVVTTGLLFGVAAQAEAQNVCNAVLTGQSNYTDMQVARSYIDSMRLHMCSINWSSQAAMQSHAGNAGLDFSIFEFTVGGSGGWSNNSSSRSSNYQRFCVDNSTYQQEQSEYQSRFVDNKYVVDAWTKCMKERGGAPAALIFQDPSRRGAIIKLSNYQMGTRDVENVTFGGADISAGTVKCDMTKPASANDALITCTKSSDVSANVGISSSWGLFGPFALEATKASYADLEAKVANYENLLKSSFSAIKVDMATDVDADFRSGPSVECDAGWEPIERRCTPSPAGWKTDESRTANGFRCDFENQGSGLQDRTVSLFAVCAKRAMK